MEDKDLDFIPKFLGKILHKEIQYKVGELDFMIEEMDKNTKIELAKALIEKLIGMQCVMNNDMNDPALVELDNLRTQVYHFNEDVIDYLINSYKLAYANNDNSTTEGVN